MHHVAMSRPVDFVLSLGDNFYEDGVVGLDDPHWWASFEEPYYWGGLRVPWYAVLGNHDYRGNPDAQIAYTAHSDRWNMPARYYRSSWPGPVNPLLDVFCLDTTTLIQRYWPGGTETIPGVVWPDPYRQLAWLEEGLHCSGARWKIVAGHHAIASASPIHGSSSELDDRLRPLLAEYGAPLYLSGHDHDLQHLGLPGGLNCVVSGAGSEVRTTGSNAHTLFSESALGFVHVQVTMADIRIAFYDIDATLLHSANVTSPMHRVLRRRRSVAHDAA
jgi:acid phosphatase